MKLIIDKSKWLRGEGATNGTSSLLRTRDGKMCCLGFVAVQCGIPPARIRNVSMPFSTSMVGEGPAAYPAGQPIDKDSKWPVGLDRDVCSKLAEINDNTGTQDDYKERYIAGRMSALGIEVEFVDGPVPDSHASTSESSDGTPNTNIT